MNVSNMINSKKLYNLYDQIFDYFNLAIYDLESKIDTSFDYKNIKHKLETLQIIILKVLLMNSIEKYSS